MGGGELGSRVSAENAQKKAVLSTAFFIILLQAADSIAVIRNQR